jgi:hypothetical protein
MTWTRRRGFPFHALVRFAVVFFTEISNGGFELQLSTCCRFFRSRKSEDKTKESPSALLGKSRPLQIARRLCG